MQNSKILTLRKDFVEDYFYHKDNKIVILKNKAFKNMDENILILAKLVEKGNESVIEPLTEEEYEQAIRKYEALVEMFDKQEE